MNIGKFQRLLLLAAISFLWSLLHTSAQTPTPTPMPARGETQSETDLVHFGDLIEVDVIGSLEYDWQGTITPEGNLSSFDRAEELIPALCRSEQEIAAAVMREYSKVLREPKVVVRILDRSNRAVAIVDGAVRTPQRFQIKRTVSLNELLVLTGGITETASGEITVFRPREAGCSGRLSGASGGTGRRGNGPQTMNIRISELLAGKREANPGILSGDIVMVVEASPVYVIGGVNTPKQVSAKTQLTVSRAVASAGGLSKEGLESEVTIFRRESKESKVIVCDLKKIQAGHAEDVSLKPYDIVDVGQKGRAKRRFPPVVFDGSAGNNKPFKMPLRVVD